MKKQLQQTIKENGYATVYIKQIAYSVMAEDLKEYVFTCMNEFGIDSTFTYDEIGRVEQ